MEVAQFSDIQAEFMHRVQQGVYCVLATADLKGRPRTRVMHVVWYGPIGWVITSPQSPKVKHLASNPHVSLAYISNPMKPVHVECMAEWVTDRAEMLRIWDVYKTIPPPLGFDPTPHYSTIEHQHFGLLQFTPWRLELAALGSESQIWRPGHPE